MSKDAALAETQSLLAALQSLDLSDNTQRVALLRQTNRIRAALETPLELASRWMETVAAAGALQLLIRIGVFDRLPADGTPISAAELAQQAGVDASVVTRCMRILVAQGLVEEMKGDVYKRNGLSDFFKSDKLGAMMCTGFMFARIWAMFPDYVKTHTPEDLWDVTKSPFVWTIGQEGKSFYEVLDTCLDPVQRSLFDLTMTNVEGMYPTRDMFPFREMKGQVELEPERPFVVDVGGGRGQVLKVIREEAGEIKGGRYILQDLPIVIESLKGEDLGEGIEVIAYDFFAEQPVKNAHIYFFRMILHGFNDAMSVQILKNTVSAMGPDSRLIVCEKLVPDMVPVGGSTELYWLDMLMMSVGGKERTVADFQRVFDHAGLELVGVYRSKTSQAAMLEGRLKRVA